MDNRIPKFEIEPLEETVGKLHYISKTNIRFLKAEKKKTNRTQSEIVDTLITQYRNQKSPTHKMEIKMLIEEASNNENWIEKAKELVAILSTEIPFHRHDECLIALTDELERLTDDRYKAPVSTFTKTEILEKLQHDLSRRPYLINIQKEYQGGLDG